MKTKHGIALWRDGFAVVLFAIGLMAWPASSFSQLPPRISVQPESQTVVPGTNVFLRVAATGTPPLFYQWRLNGQILSEQTNSFLTLQNVQAVNGGSYSVIVFNDSGAVISDPAIVVVRVSTGPSPSDSFRDRLTLSGGGGIAQGDSGAASSEPGEPVPNGGGKSIWYEWIAPANGIVTFSTRGSAFDTTLSIFTGSVLNNLVLVTRDEDGGGFYASKVRFNAQARTSYQIAVDGFGFGGAGGSFTLAWDLEVTSDLVPVIVTAPVPQGVLPGTEAIFRVLTESSTDTYQWLFNGVPIVNGVGPVYRVLSVQSSDVGLYSVRLSNQFGRFTDSAPVDLQLTPEPGVLIQDKFENMFNANRPAAGFISIGLGGTVITNDFYSQGGGQQGDPTPCNSPFHGTLWLGLTATNTGMLQIDTIGSQILSRMAVYKLTGGSNDFNNPPPLYCDLSSASNGLPCVVKFSATKGTNYTVVMEGFQAMGNLKCNSQMGIAPVINAVTQCVGVVVGGTLQLSMPATNWIPAPKCQWSRDGQPLANATNATLIMSNFNASMTGIYSVVMSNFVRAATNTIAQVIQAGPFSLGYSLITNNGNVGFVVRGTADQAFVLQNAMTADGAWNPLTTNKNPCSTLRYTNSNALLDMHRFFRAVAWP